MATKANGDAKADTKKTYICNWALNVGDTTHEPGAKLELTDAEFKALGLVNSQVLTRVAAEAKAPEA